MKRFFALVVLCSCASMYSADNKSPKSPDSTTSPKSGPVFYRQLKKGCKKGDLQAHEDAYEFAKVAAAKDGIKKKGQ